jgi:hypothetical protein
VIADLESSGDDDNTSVASAPTEAVKPATDTTVVAGTPDPDDIDALHESTVDSMGRKRTNSIPVPRVKEMRTKDQQKLLTTLAKELGMTPAEGAALKMEDVVGVIKEHGTKRTNYETKLKQVDAVEKLIATDPDRFMQIVSEINPGFKAYAKKEATAAVTKSTAEEDPEPQPDYDLGNGQFTYSVEGLRKLRAWERRQAVKEVNAGLDARLKPVEEKAKAEQERAEYEAWYNDRLAFHTQRLEKARKWPKFTDNELAIIQAMQTDPSVSLEDAYMQVVVPHLAGDRTKIRQEILDEIERQPKTSSVAVSPAVTKPADNKPKSTADIAREVMASMEG